MTCVLAKSDMIVPIFKSSDVAYWKPPNFNKNSFNFGIGYSFCFNCFFKFLKSIRKRTQFDLGLGCVKDGAPRYESFSTPRNHIGTKRSTSFLEISLCTFGTGYGHEHIVFVSSFNSKYDVSVFQVPSVLSKNS